MKKKAIAIQLLTSCALVLGGCGAGEKQGGVQDPQRETEEPVELSLYIDLATELSDDEVDEYFREPLKKKMPHITIGKVIRSGKGSERQTLLAAGEYPDLTYTTTVYLPQFREMGLAQDIAPIAKRNGFDFNQTFDKMMMDGITAMSGGGGKIMGMPFSDNWFLTIYNKDIFDKFGVPYPKDLTSLEEALELAKRLTRVDGGVQYFGLDVRGTVSVAKGLSLPLVDPVTLKSNFNTEAFRPVFQFFKDLYAIPGQIGTNGQTSFLQTKTLAMWSYPVYATILNYVNADVNWDVTTNFNFKEALPTEKEPDVHILMMSTTSKHQDAAFKVMTLVASDEVQRSMARRGRIPTTMPYSEFKDDFAAGVPAVKDKNWASVFKATKRELPPITEYQSIASAVFATANSRLMKENIDVNTLMRELQETADMKIAEEKAKKGK